MMPVIAFVMLFLMSISSIHGLSASSSFLDRRSCLEMLQLLSLSALAPETASPSSPTMTTSPTIPNIPITDKVFFDVRVARQDGSTYVRDDLPDTFENRVLKARLVLGLYGTVAPNHVQRFLSYVVPPKDDDVDNPYPSYGRSTFKSLDQETGLLLGGNIPSLRVTDVGGSSAITYGSRVLPASLWIDKPTSEIGKISHSSKGLLTHKALDVTPTFGVTTRAAPELDATHTVFGQIIWDDPTLEWFREIQDIPTYSIDRPSGYDEFDTGGVATSLFNAQREFFRGAAKSVGDSRVSKLYEGKLLRRTEVLQVGRM